MQRQVHEIRTLTGLRFLAAFLVFVQHLIGPLGWVEPEVDIGSFGVTFFFVLSGFILTYVYSNRLTYASIKDFYVRRLARVWPLHCVTLICCFALGLGLNNMGWERFLATLFLLQSWVPTESWIFAYNSVAWTLCVEALFYLLFPFFVLGGPRQFRGKMIVICVSTLAFIAFVQNAARGDPDSWIQYAAIGKRNPFVRLMEFCAGIAVGYSFLKGRNSAKPSWRSTIVEVVVSSLLILYLPVVWILGVKQQITQSVWFGSVFANWMEAVGPTPFFCLAIFVFAHSSGKISKLLGSRLMVYLGEISYAFYLIHLLVIRYLTSIEWIDSKMTTLSLMVFALVASMAFSILAYHLIELPFRTGLVLCFQRKPQQAFISIQQAIVGFFASKKLVPASLILFLLFLHLSHCRFDPLDASRMEQIMANSHVQYRHVEFEGDGLLLGLVSYKSARGVTLEMVWRLNEGHRSNRFLHICNADNAILRHGRSKIINADYDGKKWIDRVVVPYSQLTDADYLGIGFFEKDRSTAPIKSGPRRMNQRRLVVYQNQDRIEVAGRNSMKR